MLWLLWCGSLRVLLLRYLLWVVLLVELRRLLLLLHLLWLLRLPLELD